MAENILSRILEVKQAEIALLKASNIEARYQELAEQLPATRRFYAALRRPPDSPLRLIAELKKASPSRGVMVEDFKPLELAQTYHSLGARAFSVLTDQQFFQGTPDYLTSVRQAFDLPVLRKDFIIDEVQVYESRLMGADAILLIVAVLSRLRLQELMFLAHSLSLEILVEVHTEAELQIALDCGAKIIGINNRNLTDFSVDLQTSLRLRPAIPPNVVAISESGMRSTEDLHRVEEAGFDAVLIGEGLLQKENFQYQWQ